MNDNEHNPEPSPDAEEVKQFLAGSSEPEVAKGLEPGKVYELDLSDDDEIVQAEPEEPKHNGPKQPARRELYDTDKDIKAILDPYTKGLTPADVEVSSVDKDLFFKSAITGKPLYWDVEVGPVTIRVRSLSASANRILQQTIYQMINRNNEEEILTFTDSDYMDMIRELSMILQVESIDGDLLDCHFEIKEGAAIKDTATELSKHWDAVSVHMESPRRALLLRALQIFTLKHKICADRMCDPDFLQPADKG